MGPQQFMFDQWVNTTMQMMQFAKHVQASTLKLMCTNAYMKPVMEAAFGHYNESPLSLEFSGIRSLARLNPVFAGMAARFPESVTVQIGLGEGQDKKASRGFDHVTYRIDPTRPDRAIRGAAMITDLNSKEHQPVSFADLLDEPVIDGKAQDISIETVLERPFQNLTRISHSATDPDKDPIYLSAPMSGHFSTLAQAVVQNYINAGHPVYVRDIKDAARVPLSEGKFGMDEQVEYAIDDLQYIHDREGKSAQISAICQGAIPTVIATAYLSEKQEAYRPSKLFVTSAPIDVSATKSPVNKFAEKMSAGDFLHRETTIVPPWMDGAGRRVRSGRAQVGAFKGANPGLHMAGEAKIFNAVAAGDVDWKKYLDMEQAEIIRAIKSGDMDAAEQAFAEELAFRIEYHTEASHDGASYVDAGTKNFLGNFLMEGTAAYKGHVVDLSKIDCPILTIDAGNDNISSPGQTMGIYRKTNPEVDSRAMLVEGKGHFWWGGNSARKNQWNNILAWHSAAVVDGEVRAEYSSPVLDAFGHEQKEPSLPPQYDPSMMDYAVELHAANEAKEEAANNAGDPYNVRVKHGGIPSRF